MANQRGSSASMGGLDGRCATTKLPDPVYEVPKLLEAQKLRSWTRYRELITDGPWNETLNSVWYILL